MKKRISTGIILAVIFIGFLLNYYFKIEYNLNIIDYVKRSQDISKSEKVWLKNNGPIIYGSDQNSPPLRYIDSSEQYTGSVVDYIRALSIEVGKVIEFMPLKNWDDSLFNVSENKKGFFDLIPSKYREEKFDFSDSIYVLRGSIVVGKKHENIKDISSLKDKVVAIPKNDYAIEFLHNNIKDVEIIYTENLEAALVLLKDEYVDAVLGDEPVIKYLLDKMNIRDELKVLDEVIYDEKVVLAVPKGEKELLSILNKGILSVKKKDIIKSIDNKWYGVSMPLRRENNREYIILVALVFMAMIMLITYVYHGLNLILKREVYNKTYELKNSKKQLQITFDGLTHMLIVLDRELNIININKASCNFLNMTRKEIIGKSYDLLKHGFKTEELDKTIAQTFEQRKNIKMDFNYRKKIYRVSTFILCDDGESLENILIMIDDITQVKMGERKLVYENKMVAIGQLASGVAHEIRNPLGIIRNYCYLLKEDIEEEEQLEYIEIIEASVKRAGGIIDNLLDFGRLSNNEYSSTKMKRFLQGIVNLNKKTLRDENITVEISCDEDLEYCINQGSLKHVIFNLISNAIDAIDEVKSIQNKGYIKITCETNGEILEIDFTDTGEGIRKEDLENIFNPFFTTKLEKKGTGLGLYITYTEVKKFGGNISVNSKVGEGTTFHITIPRRGEN